MSGRIYDRSPNPVNTLKDWNKTDYHVIKKNPMMTWGELPWSITKAKEIKDHTQYYGNI